MDLSCENKTRLVEFKNGSLIITLIDCEKCERCQPKPIEVVDLEESDVESDTDYSPYTRWSNGRYIFIKEIIHID